MVNKVFYYVFTKKLRKKASVKLDKLGTITNAVTLYNGKHITKHISLHAHLG